MDDMDDMELLKLAAKAAGYSCWQSKHGYLNLTRPDGSSRSCCHDWQQTSEERQAPTLAEAVLEDNWNPLADGADALRLAVKLRIDFYVGEDDGTASYAGYFTNKTARQQFCVERHDDNPYAATLRAIVRAAAEIGRGVS
jgi:hypothetical protein